MKRQVWVTLTLLGLLAFFPLVTAATGQPFLRDVANRVMILGLAAVSLNFILGYGGLVSFGHAAFIGLGGYVVGIFASQGLTNGPLQLVVSICVSAFFAFITGLLAIKTRGVHFIMITMAFGQMAYYGLRALKAYGGDDGLPIRRRSDFGLFTLADSLTLYYVSFTALVLGLLLAHRLASSRFGLVLIATRDNERRVVASGLNPYRFQLVAYVIAGAMAGVAGFLLANFAGFISPAVGDWTRSAQLMFMVILGGAATLAGPLIGAATYLALEEILSRFTSYWQFFFGAILLGYVLVARGGLWRDIVARLSAKDRPT
jgi:branched-chain amino acid transport system permease protein